MKTTSRIISAVLIILILALSGDAIQLTGSEGRSVLSNITINRSDPSNATNPDLWGWGSAPKWHMLNGSQLIEGIPIYDEDKSVMETPSQLVPQNNDIENAGYGRKASEDFLPCENCSQ